MVRLDRAIKYILRGVDTTTLEREERELVTVLKKALREIRLDVRDYEHAMTRDEQLKWGKIGRHNLTALNAALLKLGGIIGAADTAELGALIETVRDSLA